MSIKCAILSVLTVLLLSCCLSAYGVGPVPRMGEDEIEVGKEASKEIEKEYKLLDDPEVIARVARIGDAVAAVANSTEIASGYGSSTIVPFTYTFKIIDSEDVNALSIPGGHIYIHRGLIDKCQSDDELAGVIAHEVAHAAHHHMVYLLREQSRLEGKMALVLVAGLLGNIRTSDLSNVMMGAQFYKTARTNGYGQKAERDADVSSVEYAIKAGYNPVGVLTFLERLADKPETIDWGIYQTHPPAWERVSTVKSRLLEMGVEINRRAVTTSLTAAVRTGDPTGFEVVVGEKLICRLSDKTRAQTLSNHINRLLDRGLRFCDLSVDNSTVTACDEMLLLASEEDAVLAGTSSEQLAQDVLDRLRGVLFRQMIADLW